MPKKLHFLIIMGKTGPNHIDIINAITDAGHISHTFSINDATIKIIQGKEVVFFQEYPLSFFDIIIPRTIQTNLSLGRFILCQARAEQFVLDECIAHRDTFGKISQGKALLDKKINHPKTIYTANADALPLIINALSFPCVAKPVSGRQGAGVTLVRDQNEAIKIIKEHAMGYLFQEYLPIQFDYRIFVVGGKAIGGIQRHISKNDFRTNASVGSEVTNTKMTAALRSTAIQATAVFGYDIAGVDIAIVNGRHYVFEVNRSPQWQAFKKATGINPAKHIIEYAIKKHHKKHRAA
ncbi:MAG: ATP-grasp domain-containing protein [Candidatus Moraniibacteriota bacterium]